MSSKPLFSFRLATASQEEVVGDSGDRSLSFSPEAQESSTGLSKDAKWLMAQGISVHISFEDVIHQENGETKFSKEVTNLEGLLQKKFFYVS